MLVFVIIAGKSAASPTDTGVAASAKTQAQADNEAVQATDIGQVDPGNSGEPAAPATAPSNPTNPGGNTGDGGVAPTSDGNATGNTTGGGSGGAREPDFVEQDPSLSAGGVSPDGNGEDPFVLDRLNVPNFVINNFEIPPFLLPIYQACGSEYGVPWEVLAAINRIETGFGTNVGTSTAGAYGWMQFIHSSWVEWGVDANGDKLKDPFNPVDAICAAGNYLDDFGYSENPYDAIFAYNHADWYVQDILENARAYSAIPPEVINSLTGLTEGARFPIAAESTYEGQVSTEKAKKDGTASQDVSSSDKRTSIAISAEAGSPVIAVNDGVITDIDQSSGTIVLEDVYGNRYSYAGLGSVASVHPVPQHESNGTTPTSESDSSLAADTQGPIDADGMGAAKAADQAGKHDADSNPQAKAEALADKSISEVLVDPDAAAQGAADQAAGAEAATDSSTGGIEVAADRRAEQQDLSAAADENQEILNTEDMRGRTYASPLRPSNQNRSTIEGRSTQTATTAVALSGGVEGKPGDYLIYDGSKAGVYKFKPGTAVLKPLRKGSKVIAGTVLGRLVDQANASLTFSIKPGGEDTPQIDPKPFLDGWRLLAETNIYNAQGKDRFADRLGVGGVLLLSKSALQRRVLADENIDLSDCDRQYVASGIIDRRLLAALSFLSEKGYSLLITSLYCGREASITTSGNISNHSTASAADIAAINGEVVTPATQGPGSLTDSIARQLLTLQGIMAPDEVISLLDYPQPAGFAMGDHGDHLHLGFGAAGDGEVPAGTLQATLGAAQWQRLTERLGEIQNPEVPGSPSDDALPAERSDKGK